MAANYNNQEVIRYALEQFDAARLTRPEEYSQERKRGWLNAKDNDGFTCLHYSVFRGNTPLALLLEEHGSDVYMINKQGLNALHIAAQGDSPFLMVGRFSLSSTSSTRASKLAQSTPTDAPPSTGLATRDRRTLPLLCWHGEPRWIVRSSLSE